jgi:hypothetical protein
MEQTTTSTESQTYQIGGRTFTVRPVVARQEKWLWPLMKPLFQKGESITVEDIFAVMGDSITRMAAILLLAEGQTQPEKVRAGLAGVDQLEAWLDETVSVSELGPVIADFFASGQQWKLFTGLAGPLHHSATTGSTRPSALWPMATSSEPTGSGRTSDSASADAISSEAGSAVPWSAPSSVSVG